MRFESGVVAVVGVEAMAVLDFLMSRSHYEYKVPRRVKVHHEVISKVLGLSRKTVIKSLDTLELIKFLVVDRTSEDTVYQLSEWKDGEIGKYEDVYGTAFVNGIHYRLQAWCRDNGFEDVTSVPHKIVVSKCREVLYPNV